MIISCKVSKKDVYLVAISILQEVSRPRLSQDEWLSPRFLQKHSIIVLIGPIRAWVFIMRRELPFIEKDNLSRNYFAYL